MKLLLLQQLRVDAYCYLIRRPVKPATPLTAVHPREEKSLRLNGWIKTNRHLCFLFVRSFILSLCLHMCHAWIFTHTKARLLNIKLQKVTILMNFYKAFNSHI